MIKKTGFELGAMSTTCQPCQSNTNTNLASEMINSSLSLQNSMMLLLTHTPPVTGLNAFQHILPGMKTLIESYCVKANTRVFASPS